MKLKIIKNEFVNINSPKEEGASETQPEPQDGDDENKPTQWDSHLFELAAKTKID